jgi:predicted RNase H-like HicB family nuclease
MRFRTRQSNRRRTVAEYSYTVVFQPAEEGRYVATCSALPGVITEAATYEQARARITEAIAVHLQSLQKYGLPIPVDEEITLERVKEQIRIALAA